jgi:hypothetical protein
MTQPATEPMTADQVNFARQALSWHGWASPVGLGIFLVSLAVTALVIRMAIFGI